MAQKWRLCHFSQDLTKIKNQSFKAGNFEILVILSMTEYSRESRLDEEVIHRIFHVEIQV